MIHIKVLYIRIDIGTFAFIYVCYYRTYIRIHPHTLWSQATHSHAGLRHGLRDREKSHAYQEPHSLNPEPLSPNPYPQTLKPKFETPNPEP